MKILKVLAAVLLLLMSAPTYAKSYHSLEEIISQANSQSIEDWRITLVQERADIEQHFTSFEHVLFAHRELEEERFRSLVVYHALHIRKLMKDKNDLLEFAKINYDHLLMQWEVAGSLKKLKILDLFNELEDFLQFVDVTGGHFFKAMAHQMPLELTSFLAQFENWDQVAKHVSNYPQIPASLRNFIFGTDWREKTTVEIVKKGTILKRLGTQNGPFFTHLDADVKRLGTSQYFSNGCFIQEKPWKCYRVQRDFTAFISTIADCMDSWSLAFSIPVKGGAQQILFLSDNGTLEQSIEEVPCPQVN